MGGAHGASQRRHLREGYPVSCNFSWNLGPFLDRKSCNTASPSDHRACRGFDFLLRTPAEGSVPRDIFIPRITFHNARQTLIVLCATSRPCFRSSGCPCARWYFWQPAAEEVCNVSGPYRGTQAFVHMWAVKGKTGNDRSAAKSARHLRRTSLKSERSHYSPFRPAGRFCRRSDERRRECDQCARP
jgi:hypothetical protein